ncbi:MAG: iron ABC transporter permease [Candidatus Bipolaricaulota bacterium]
MKARLLLLFLALGTVLTVLGAIAVGPVRIPLGEVVRALTQPQEGDLYSTIVHGIRLPRVLLGYLVGLSLSLSGAVLQGVFRNPLASPYVLGIASGASTGAAVTIALGLTGTVTLPVGAFLGGALAVILVYALARPKGGARDRLGLILAGVALGALFSAVTGFILFLTAGDRRLAEILFWTMGGLGRADWTQIWALLPMTGVTGLGLWSLSRELNALSLGDEGAFSLGIRPQRLKLILLSLTTVLTATAVAFAGTIGFVGLITPHAMRILLGPDHRYLLPASALVGGIFLAWADAAARTVLRPAELPLGILTALIGAPFFLYLLQRRRGGEMG